MFAGDALLAEEVVPVDIPFRWNPNGAFLTVGFGRGFPVCDDYSPPFRFNGALDQVVIGVGESTLPEPTRRIETAFRHQ
jgi:arylsulfatase